MAGKKRVWTVCYGYGIACRWGPLFYSESEAERYAQRLDAKADKENPYHDWVCDVISVRVFSKVEDFDEWEAKQKIEASE